MQISRSLLSIRLGSHVAAIGALALTGCTNASQDGGTARRGGAVRQRHASFDPTTVPRTMP